MRTEQIALSPLAPGASLSLTVQRFGAEGARPQVYIQASLHADEIPGMIVAHHLRERLKALEAEGRIKGEIVLVPSANPIGLAQRVMGDPIGRFNLADGVNFNRGYPHLIPKAAERVEGKLTGDGAANVRLIREALRAELDAWEPANPAEALKKTLLGLGQEADLVLDLHCDSEAVVHLYTHTQSEEEFAPLSALIGAHAYLLADESGDEPFDEACSRPWAELAARFSDRPIPFGCHSTTLEFRGERDVDHATAGTDAAAIARLPDPARSHRRRGPERAGSPLPGDAAGGLRAGPGPGLRHPGVQDRAGNEGEGGGGDRRGRSIRSPARSRRPRLPSDGVMFARIAVRFVTKGMRIAKVAGTEATRTGKLLGA